MTKRDRIITGILLVIVGIICLFAMVDAEVFQVVNVSGGLQVAKDSTTLQPNEAMVMDNLVLDPGGLPKVRQGYSYWDSLAFKADSEIQAIYVYEPYPDSQRMVVACNGFVYIWYNLTDPGDVDWDTLRLRFTDGDSLSVTNGNAQVTDVNAYDWWTLRISVGDIFDIAGTEYEVDGMVTSNAKQWTLESNWAGSTDTLSYVAYKYLGDNPYFTQYQDKLYMCSEDEYPLVYNDTLYNFISLVDTGTVSDTFTADTSMFMYNLGHAQIIGRTAYGLGDANWGANSGIVAAGGDVFIYKPYVYDRNGLQTQIYWEAQIDSVDSLQRTARLNKVFDYPEGMTSGGRANPYEIRRAQFDCGDAAANIIEDSGKNWLDDELGTDYLTSFRFVHVDSGYNRNSQIYCNEESTLAVTDYRYNPSANYYIFSQTPTPEINAATVNDLPVFQQIMFYNDMLYGFGQSQPGISRQGNYGNIWYSHISLPFYLRYDYSLSIDKSDNITAMSIFRDRLFFASKKGIWRLSGIPNLRFLPGNAVLSQVVSGQGIPDIDNWVKATEEYGYFVNRFGVYRFDGVRPQKISWNVDPLIQDNYGSRIVMVYQDYNLYVSFPDSNFTLIYDERFGVFTTKLSFGMTCAYAPPDTNIIYFGHPTHKGQVFYYPNGVYYNQLSTATETYSTAYESGWMADGGYWKNKRFRELYWSINGTVAAEIKFYTDFSSTPCDTAMCDSTGIFVYRKQFDNDCIGEYHKIRIEGGADSAAVFGGYRIDWEPIPQSKK